MDCSGLLVAPKTARLESSHLQCSPLVYPSPEFSHLAMIGRYRWAPLSSHIESVQSPYSHPNSLFGRGSREVFFVQHRYFGRCRWTRRTALLFLRGKRLSGVAHNGRLSGGQFFLHCQWLWGRNTGTWVGFGLLWLQQVSQFQIWPSILDSQYWFLWIGRQVSPFWVTICSISLVFCLLEPH